MSRRIPVVMFHSVDQPDPRWLWHGLTSPVDTFARKVKALANRGFRSIGLDEVRDAQQSRSVGSERRVVLTFDDGYLDNWVHVYPLLKRVGWKGIVYVNPEFVEPGDQPRPTLEDVWSGRLGAADLQTRGFLNWAEIDALQHSGVLEIGSHSMTHTWYASGGEIDDFHRPGLATPWLSWNARPDRKPYYLVEDQSGFVPWGYPVHRSGRSLGIRRFFPDEDVAPACMRHVAANGGASYFNRPNWAADLRAVAAEADRGCGRAETDEEMASRFKWEIDESIRLLRARIGASAGHFCWPGGAYCDASWQIAENSELRTLTVKRGDNARWTRDDARLVRRISEFREYSFAGKKRRTDRADLLVAACDLELGLAGAKLKLRSHKVWAGIRG